MFDGEIFRTNLQLSLMKESFISKYWSLLASREPLKGKLLPRLGKPIIINPYAAGG